MHRRELLKLVPGLLLANALPRGVHAAQTAGLGISAAGLGLNLTPVTYWTTEHPFRNLAGSASRWRLQEISGPFSWDLPLPEMTSDGYPLTIPPGNFLESFLVFTHHRRHLGERLVVAYDGEGTIDYLYGGQLVSRAPGRDLVRNLPNDGPITARLVSTSSRDPLCNIRIHEEGAAVDETFRSEFLQRLSRMSVLRFMDWMDTNNSRTTSWNQRPRPDRFTHSQGGVALELIVELANRLAVPPWFTIPHLADDDFVRRFAEQVRETLNPEIPAYVEYSNEVWNTLFEQAEYARQEGQRLGLSGNEHEARLRFYSQRTSQILSIWEDVFGGDSDRVIGVYSAHAVNDWTSEAILSWRDARDHADVLAVAPYFGGALGNRDHAPRVSAWTLDDLFDALTEEIDGPNREFIARQAAIADRFGVQLVAYEGGQHLVGHSGTNHDEVLHSLFAAANRDERIGELYHRHIQHWRNAGGGVYALYNSMGEYNKWGCWGLLEHEDDGVVAPKWRAVQEMVSA